MATVSASNMWWYGFDASATCHSNRQIGAADSHQVVEAVRGGPSRHTPLHVGDHGPWTSASAYRRYCQYLRGQYAFKTPSLLGNLTSAPERCQIWWRSFNRIS
jgi:hypothetical protein